MGCWGGGRGGVVILGSRDANGCGDVWCVEGIENMKKIFKVVMVGFLVLVVSFVLGALAQVQEESMLFKFGMEEGFVDKEFGKACLDEGLEGRCFEGCCLEGWCQGRGGFCDMLGMFEEFGVNDEQCVKIEEVMNEMCEKMCVARESGDCGVCCEIFEGFQCKLSEILMFE